MEETKEIKEIKEIDNTLFPNNAVEGQMFLEWSSMSWFKYTQGRWQLYRPSPCINCF